MLSCGDDTHATILATGPLSCPSQTLLSEPSLKLSLLPCRAQLQPHCTNTSAATLNQRCWHARYTFAVLGNGKSTELGGRGTWTESLPA